MPSTAKSLCRPQRASGVPRFYTSPAQVQIGNASTAHKPTEKGSLCKMGAWRRLRLRGPNPGTIQAMDVPPRLTGGELNAAVTRAVIRVHTSSLGRGPKKAVSFHSGNVLVTLLEDAMTNAERTLAGNGDGDAVLAMRALFQRSMADELKADVGRLTGHQVTAFISGNHLDPDLAVEIFILDGEISGRPLPPGRGGV